LVHKEPQDIQELKERLEPQDLVEQQVLKVI
jgi:hypothetical protein